MLVLISRVRGPYAGGIRRRWNPPTLDVNGCNDYAGFKMVKEDTEKSHDEEQCQSKIRECVIERGIPEHVSMEGAKEYQVLIGQHHHHTQKEPNGELSWKALQHKRSQNTKCKVHYSCPNRSKHQCLGSIFRL